MTLNQEKLLTKNLNVNNLHFNRFLFTFSLNTIHKEMLTCHLK